MTLLYLRPTFALALLKNAATRAACAYPLFLARVFKKRTLNQIVTSYEQGN